VTNNASPSALHAITVVIRSKSPAPKSQTNVMDGTPLEIQVIILNAIGSIAKITPNISHTENSNMKAPISYDLYFTNNASNLMETAF
jgi:hypothetical protein